MNSEEWQWIKKLFKSQKTSESDVEEDKSDCKTEEFEHPKDSQQPTTAQLLFQSQIQRAANKLLTSMGIYENVQQHRYILQLFLQEIQQSSIKNIRRLNG